MARTNFSFKKRQQEIERKKKQDEKRQRKLAKKAADSGDAAVDAGTDGALMPEPEAAPSPDAERD